MPLILRVDADTKTATSKIKAASKSAGASIKKLETDSVKSTARMRQSFGGLAGSIGALRNKLLVFGFATAGTIKLFKTLITESSDLEESINAVNVVFKDGAGIILNFGKVAAESVGLANSEFNQLATETGALLVNTGIPLSEVSDLTIKLTKRAADLASVFNTDVKLAFSAINQAIRGETEAIRKFSGDVTDASLQTFLFSKGINTLVSSLSQEEKRLLRVELLLKQTSVTSGDFLNTQDSLANATRILGARVSNLAANFGDGLVPAAENAVRIMGKFVTVTENFLKLQEKLDKFAGGPLSNEAIENFKLAQEGFKGVSDATKEFLDLIKEVDAAEAQAAAARTGELNRIEKIKGITGVNQDIEALEARIKIREVSETQLTLTLQALGVTRETLELQNDLITLSQNKVLLEQAANTLITTRLEMTDEIALRESQARIAAINAAEAAEETATEADRIADRTAVAADAAGQFAQNLARALETGQNLGDVIKRFAINLALSFAPGGSNFGGFKHGGIAPGGFVPSIVGEGGGAPEIVQSASPIRVTPLTTNNDNSRRIININITTTDLSDFALKNDIIPRIRRLDGEF